MDSQIPSTMTLNVADVQRMITAAAHEAAHEVDKQTRLTRDDVEGMIETGIERFCDRLGIPTEKKRDVSVARGHAQNARVSCVSRRTEKPWLQGDARNCDGCSLDGPVDRHSGGGTQMRRLVFTWPAFFAAIIVWPAATALGLWLFFNVTPWIEAVIAPVLDEQSIEVSDRKPGQMCWTWKWNKTREALPTVVAWTTVVRGSAVEFPAITRRERTGEVIRTPQPAPLGKGQNSFCADIPPAIDRERGLVILGVVNYRMPHGLWTMWQSIPPVNVPPLP